MKISEMKAVVKENFRQQRTPLFFHGSPGIGKTEGIEQAIAELCKEDKKEYILRTIILSQYESVDLRGLPNVKDGLTKWNPPDDLTFAPDARGIVFFDEMSNAAPDVQKAAQQIIHARRLGELKIPEEIVFVAAGNRQTDKAGANRILTALANRFEHHDIESDHEDWLGWAIKANLDHSIIAYIAWKPSSLNAFDSNRSVNPTPRTWVKVHYLMSSSFFEDRVIGTVGKGEGSEFLAHRKVWDKLPSCEKIWDDPDKVDMPKEQSIVYATAMSLALKATPKNFPNALKFMQKAGKEMQVLYVKYACKADKTVRATKEFSAYLKLEKDVLFN